MRSETLHCPSTRDLLPAYLNGTLEADLAGQVREHLAACQNCHRDSFCVNCHQNRDSILTVVHDRNYLSYHSIDARANPIECGNCHREDFCSQCHARAAK